MKNKTRIKTYLWVDLSLYAFAFLISIAGMLCILMSRGFYPFGQNTLFIMDMQSQFMEFFASLRYTINGDNSIFYSWSRSLGGNYLGLYSYYLASPLSWITVLFPIEEFHAAILVLTLLKIGSCGLTFSIFASYLWNRFHPVSESIFSTDIRNYLQKLILLPLAVSYALISYNMTYSSCLMWIDGVILLPLVLLGVEKLLNGQKGLLYMLFLAASFISNYFTGYMVGIFTAIYLLFRLCSLVTRQTFTFYLQRVFRFVTATFLAIGLASPILLAVVRDLASGRLTSSSEYTDTITNFPFIRLLTKFTNGSYSNIIYETLPNIYCGYIGLALALLFFALRRISLREKLAAAGVILLLLLSFYLTKLNYFWQGFQAFIGFSHRYSFVFSFFVLYLAVRTLSALPFSRLLSNRHKSCFRLVALLVMIVVSVDMGLNGRSIIYGLEDDYDYDTVDNYQGQLSVIKPLTDNILDNDDGFYRINQGYEYANNDAMLLGFNGMSHYSSTFNQKVNSLTSRLGFAQAHFWNSGHGSTPLTDSLLGVKYYLHKVPVPSFYTKIKDTEYGASSYLNENALSIVYSAPLSDEEMVLDSDSPFTNQNALLNGIAGTNLEYFSFPEFDTAGDDSAWSYSFTAKSDCPVYLYMKSPDFSPTKVLVNGTEVGGYFSHETNCILYLGNFSPEEKVLVDVLPVNPPVHVEHIEIAVLNTDLLESTLQTLMANGMQIIDHRGGRLKGTIYVPEGQKIVTSIPYDTGWTVKIDGEKVPLQKYAETFLSVETESGEHTVSFIYLPPGFAAGMIIFLMTLLLSVFYFHPGIVRLFLIKRRKTA